MTERDRHGRPKDRVSAAAEAQVRPIRPQPDALERLAAAHRRQTPEGVCTVCREHTETARVSLAVSRIRPGDNDKHVVGMSRRVCGDCAAELYQALSDLLNEA